MPNSFSTLYGSKWVATYDPAPGGVTNIQFQYPLRVEVGCNLPNGGKRSLGLEVSVPSTGRSGLQLVEFHHSGLVGRGFSTLYGSKWVATGARRPVGYVFGVSVPSTGRSGLQVS